MGLYDGEQEYIPSGNAHIRKHTETWAMLQVFCEICKATWNLQSLCISLDFYIPLEKFQDSARFCEMLWEHVESCHIVGLLHLKIS